ncbi:related to glycosyl hydrolase, family 15 [Serendipita indica DSM 11827]|uniref:Related to glycosyl hydrolase, family 15 n=1 Tax=Serendipita indica (strain DSM 11827) TaxID=1109443 RepID=G4U004_SERID|nr:related to glycosyl hydrolase, family 15 [Serendipita indica DSM 11827]
MTYPTQGRYRSRSASGREAAAPAGAPSPKVAGERALHFLGRTCGPTGKLGRARCADDIDGSTLGKGLEPREGNLWTGKAADYCLFARVISPTPQSYDEPHILDSAVLVAPLVFFCPASDPRFLSTLRNVLKSPERGGLSSNSLVYRYDTKVSDDGFSGEEEGFFSLCSSSSLDFCAHRKPSRTHRPFYIPGTLWCIEALTRAGEYDSALLQTGVRMFEDFIGYSNHVGLFTEEVSVAGEG